MSYHPSLLKNETRERILNATLSPITLTEREQLVIEEKSLRIVLRAEPSPTLRTNAENRLIEIALQRGALTEEEALRLTRKVLRALPV